MVFSSNIFLFAFLPWVLLGYFLCPRRFRNAFLLAASLLFFAWGEPKHPFLLAVSIVANYLAGLLIARYRSKRLLIAAIAVNLGALFAFKYANFVADNLNLLLPRLGLPVIHLPPIQLPIGISFFTFQAIAYIVDVYTQEVDVERSGVQYGLYAALFPHLIAGPIVRYRDIADQLNERTITTESFAEGVRRFIIGLAKKALIANTLAVTADQVFQSPAKELSAAAAWLGLVCYSLQIYFDFSGYSDMAIGLGKMFGFDFLENFNLPYSAQSVTDFWRRWHISLSSWLRDYVYIPLGGSRCSPRRVLLNLLIVFVLCGLWHGASWCFLLWGLWHGAFLVGERLGGSAGLSKSPRLVRHGYTLLAVMGGWVLFRADNLKHAGQFFRSLAGFGSGFYDAAGFATRETIVAIIVGGFAAYPAMHLLNHVKSLATNRPRWQSTLSAGELVACSLLFALSIATLASGSYNPFLYYRF